MGLTLNDAMQYGSFGGLVKVTLVSNQDLGVATYASGALGYNKTTHNFSGLDLTVEHLSTSGGIPLTRLFSDRVPAFAANATEPLKLTISRRLGFNLATATFTTKAGQSFTVTLQELGNVYFGLGAPVEQVTDHALYVLSFQKSPV